MFYLAFFLSPLSFFTYILFLWCSFHSSTSPILPLSILISSSTPPNFLFPFPLSLSFSVYISSTSTSFLLILLFLSSLPHPFLPSPTFLSPYPLFPLSSFPPPFVLSCHSLSPPSLSQFLNPFIHAFHLLWTFAISSPSQQPPFPREQGPGVRFLFLIISSSLYSLYLSPSFTCPSFLSFFPLSFFCIASLPPSTASVQVNVIVSCLPNSCKMLTSIYVSLRGVDVARGCLINVICDCRRSWGAIITYQWRQ